MRKLCVGKMPVRTFLVTLSLLSVFGGSSAQIGSHTPIVGHKGTKCYDDFNRPQRCIPEFENAAFDVLMEATNTCGDQGNSEFCVQSGVDGLRKSCEICHPHDHHARYLTDFHNQDQPTWWQSETMYEGIQFPNQVNLTLKLGKAFDITYVRLVFYSPRPESFSIFKKVSEDSAWTPYQYYSATCRDTYNLPESSHTTRGDETRALCTSEYSDISPLRGGNVAFSTLEGRPSAYNFDGSPELQEWVTATELMVSLDRINTFGDEVFGDQQVLRSYFYAVADVAVGARCKCNGHASECILSTGVDGSRRRVCKCEHNTAGPDCNECLPFYNDAPWRRATARDAYECKQCNCNGFSNRCFHDEKLYKLTGHGGHCLDCAANRDGPNCERCRPNYFMREDGYCIPCDCNEEGSLDTQCNNEGKCICKPGVTGDKCDRCAENHFNFGPKGCDDCGCSSNGSAGNQPTCDPYNGTCVCKENVEGKQCKVCKPGFFNLDRENIFGCTPCFCFGHSAECISKPGYGRYKHVSEFSKDTDHWLAEDDYHRRIEVKHIGQIHSASAQSYDDETVYFLAPQKFLGDQRASYNQLLHFSLAIGEHDRPIPTAADIILEGVHGYVTNTIFAQENPIPGPEKQKYQFRLHEHPNYGWQPRLNSRSFIAILTNLTAIKVRASYSPRGIGYLDNVILESALKDVPGSEIHWMEDCTCPTGFVGQFCESCSAEYHHSPALGGPFMPCVPCDCNNHASICETETGKCICSHNTTGENCEFCARGYYGDALGGTPYDCQPCNCPNGGACIQLDEDIIMCTECPLGYTGHKCDSCSDGYFGDPTGRWSRNNVSTPCTPCDCNLNVDQNAIGNCNTTTGECLKCIYNTGGSRCEKCLPGFFGNALAVSKGDCQPCSCYPIGTHPSTSGSVSCDVISGRCLCKPYVAGRSCDQCEEGYYNIQSGEGCQSCNCNPTGSFNQSCDINTGQCYCRPGVTGLRCDVCKAYMYGFSRDGCKPCECDQMGSKGAQCDASGQCPCLDNVEGRRCDRCKENKYDRQRGCIDCPDCYNLVQDASRRHQNKLTRLNEILDEIERRPTVIDDDDFPEQLDQLENEIDDFYDKVKNATGTDSLMQQVQDIKNRGKEINRTLSSIDENVFLSTDKANVALLNIDNTDAVLEEADVKLSEAHDNLDNQGRKALDNARQRSKIVGQQSDNMTKIAQEARELADKLDEDAMNLTETANVAKNISDQAYTLARNAITAQNNVSEEERQISSDLTSTRHKLERAEQWTEEVSRKAQDAKRDAVELLNEVSNLILPEIDINQLKNKSKQLSLEAEKLRNETNLIFQNNEQLLEEIKEQLLTGEDQLDKGETQQNYINNLLNDIDLYKVQAEQAVEMGNKILNNTKETYKTLADFDRQVAESKQESEEALKAIDEIEQILDSVIRMQTQTNTTVAEAKRNSASALEKAIQADDLAKNASVNAENIKNDAELLLQNATGLNREADLMSGRVSNTEGEFKTLFDHTRSNDTLINQAKDKVGRAGKDTAEASKKVTDLLKDVNSIITELQNLSTIDESDLNRLEQELKKAEEKVNEAHLDQKLEELQKKQKQQNEKIDFYNAEILRLQKEVENVEQIAKSLPLGCFKRVELEP